MTLRHRQWLRELVELGGDPDGPEAMYHKEKIAQVEQMDADLRNERDRRGLDPEPPAPWEIGGTGR